MTDHENDSARNSILTKLRRTQNAVAHIQSSLTSPSHNICRGNILKFKENLVGNEIRVDLVDNSNQAIPLIAEFLQQLGFPAELKIGLALSSLDWKSCQLTAKTGSTEGGDLVCASQAYAGIEDTGTLVLLSATENPTLLHFLPDHHIVFLSQQRVMSSKVDLWNLFKQEQQQMPRALNLISGPSRTADIEQTIQLGAHGPRSLWLFLTATP